MKKTFGIIYIILFFLLCALPSLAMPFYKADANMENKRPAPAPILRKNGQLNMNYLADAEKYYNDRFAFRQEFVTAASSLEAALFKTSAIPKVLLGQDGWLYYRMTLDDYQGRNQLEAAELAALAHNLALVRDYAESRGADFLFTVAPNKNSLYGEHMPAHLLKTASDDKNLTRLPEYLAKESLSYLDMPALFQKEGELSQQKDDEALYFSRDSHWNHKGAYRAYQAMLNGWGLHERRPATAPLPGNQVGHVGDLDKMLYPACPDPEEDTDVQARLSALVDGGHEGKDDYHFSTTNPEGEGKLLFFRDSFGDAIAPLLADQFAHVLFLRSQPCDLSSLEARDTDHVLFEIVERNIKHLLIYPPMMPAPRREAPRPEVLCQIENAAETETGEKTKEVEAGRGLAIKRQGSYVLIHGNIEEACAFGEGKILLGITPKDGSTSWFEAFQTLSDPAKEMGKTFPGDTGADGQKRGYQLYLKPTDLESEQFHIQVIFMEENGTIKQIQQGDLTKPRG